MLIQVGVKEYGGELFVIVLSLSIERVAPEKIKVKNDLDSLFIYM